jgi:hypothetical protein
MPHQPNPYQNLGEELYHKLWATKGARFYAHKRFLKKSRLSNQTIGYLTAYVIIINLLGLFDFSKTFILSARFISFSTTALSILVLVFSQIESSFQYNLKADKYHDCAKAIGKLYLKLRDIMLSKVLTEAEKENEYRIIADKYAIIIDAYENHDNIDYQMFRSEYYKEFSVPFGERFYISLKFYFLTFLLYHVLIIAPVLLSVYLYIHQ